MTGGKAATPPRPKGRQPPARDPRPEVQGEPPRPFTGQAGRPASPTPHSCGQHPSLPFPSFLPFPFPSPAAGHRGGPASQPASWDAPSRRSRSRSRGRGGQRLRAPPPRCAGRPREDGAGGGSLRGNPSTAPLWGRRLPCQPQPSALLTSGRAPALAPPRRGARWARPRPPGAGAPRRSGKCRLCEPASSHRRTCRAAAAVPPRPPSPQRRPAPK